MSREKRTTSLERAPTERRVGRPRESEPRAAVCVWMPISQYNRLYELAKKEEKSLSRTARDLLVIELG